MPKYTTGILADAAYSFPNQVKYGKGNYNNVNTALFSKYKPTGKDQHRDDRVKLINHPTHPKRGRFTKDGMKFYMSDFGMNNPNLTLFGAPDNYPDGQTTMIYKGGIVLPEITVTHEQKYIDNPYDQIKIYPNIIKKHQQGGNFQINNSQPQVLQRYISLVNKGIPQQAAFDTSHLSMVEDGRPGKYYSFGRRASNLEGWTENATDSLTTGRYKNLQNAQNFNQFKQGLKKKNYNTRPSFYNTEMNRGRNKNKQIINQWNKEQGLSPIALVSNSNIVQA